MAVKIIVGVVDPLRKFAQSSLGIAGNALSAKHFPGAPDPLDHFAVSSLAVPGVPAGSFKPMPPLPGVAISGGSYGFPT